VPERPIDRHFLLRCHSVELQFHHATPAYCPAD
jgi:hypothetical protein